MMDDDEEDGCVSDSDSESEDDDDDWETDSGDDTEWEDEDVEEEKQADEAKSAIDYILGGFLKEKSVKEGTITSKTRRALDANAQSFYPKAEREQTVRAQMASRQLGGGGGRVKKVLNPNAKIFVTEADRVSRKRKYQTRSVAEYIKEQGGFMNQAVKTVRSATPHGGARGQRVQRQTETGARKRNGAKGGTERRKWQGTNAAQTRPRARRSTALDKASRDKPQYGAGGRSAKRKRPARRGKGRSQRGQRSRRGVILRVLCLRGTWTTLTRIEAWEERAGPMSLASAIFAPRRAGIG